MAERVRISLNAKGEGQVFVGDADITASVKAVHVSGGIGYGSAPRVELILHPAVVEFKGDAEVEQFVGTSGPVKLPELDPEFPAE